MAVGQTAIDYPAPKPDIPTGQYVYLYDATLDTLWARQGQASNVGQLVAWTSGFGGASGDEWHADRLVAHYEYDPYGNVVNQTGACADESPFLFSTKYFDNETGLGSPPGRRYLPHRVSTLRCTPVPKDLHNPGRMNRGPLRQPTRTACCYLSKAAASLVSQLSQCQLECDVTFRSRVR